MLEHAGLCRAADRLEPQMFDEYGVQRGLRDKNGNGVVAGLTNISRIESFKMEDGKKVPCEGKLWYRGYDCIELVNGFRGDHQVVRIDVDHHRRRPQQNDHIEGGNPGLGWGNHFIAGANAHRHQRYVHPTGSGADGDRKTVPR